MRVVSQNRHGITYGDWINFKTGGALYPSKKPIINSSIATPNTPLSTFNSMKYNWSYRNELLTVSGMSNNNTYVYDDAGSRVKATVGGVNMYYPSKLYSRLSATDKTKYIYAPSTGSGQAGNMLIGTVRMVDSVVTPYYTHTDHLGSTNAVSNSAGATTELMDYYSYGADRISTGSCDLKRKYIGQYCDNDISLAYLNARYYNSYGGRFISQDPMFWSPEKFLLDPQSLNSYSYARNNPISLSDANGMMWSGSELLEFAGGAVIGAGIAIGTAAAIGAIAVASPLIATVAVGALVVYGAAELGIATYESYESNNGSIGGMVGDLKSWASDNPGEVGGIIGGMAGCSLACKGASQLGAKGANKLGGMIKGVFEKKSIGWARPETLQDHFIRHGANFGAKNPNEYVNKLSEFINKKHYTNTFKEGVDTVYWNKNTNQAVYVNGNGNIKSGYKITSQNKINDYWNRVK